MVRMIYPKVVIALLTQCRASSMFDSVHCGIIRVYYTTAITMLFYYIVQLVFFATMNEIHRCYFGLSANHAKYPSELIAFGRGFIHLSSYFSFIYLDSISEF